MANYGNPIKKINNVDVSYIPSSWKETESDVSPDESGRDLTGLMHKNKMGSVCKFEMAFENIDTATMHNICQLVKVGEYITVEVLEPMNGVAPDYTTSEVYYVGDRTAELYNSNLDIWSSLKFNIIERGMH